RSRFSRRTISRTRPIAANAGRGRYAPVAATTKRTCATEPPRIPTFTTVSGFVDGPTPVWRCTAKSRSGTRRFSDDSTGMKSKRKQSCEGVIMRHLKPINQKAGRVVEHAAAQTHDVVALQNPQVRPHLPMGCTFLFSPG